MNRTWNKMPEEASSLSDVKQFLERAVVGRVRVKQTTSQNLWPRINELIDKLIQATRSSFKNRFFCGASRNFIDVSTSERAFPGFLGDLFCG